MNFRRRQKPELPGFQIAPMIDVMFILLSFFIATQIYARWEKEIDIRLPTADTGKSFDRLPGQVILNILQDGSVVVNKQSLNDAGLKRLLARLVKYFPGEPVVIRADKQTPYEHVIRVLDRCRQADIWNISFATAIPGTGPEPAAGK